MLFDIGLRAATTRSPYLGLKSATVPSAVRRGLSVPLVLASSQRAQAALRDQIVRRAVASTRLYSNRHLEKFRERFTLTEFGLLDNFVPSPRETRPSIFSKKGYQVTLRHWKNTLSTLMGLTMLRLRRKGWNKADFERTAESCYDLMNEAFAKGDKQTLETICMSGMYSKLKNEIKNRKGRFEWKKTRTLAPPTIVQARIGKLGKDMSLGQLVVKIEQEQAVAVYNKANQLAAGDISKPVRVKEYIVFQCMVTDPNSRWMIYGKLNEGK